MRFRIVAFALAFLAAAFLGTINAPQEQQHGSSYSTLNGTSNLFYNNGVDDSLLRACDGWTNGYPYTAWAKDKQSGNYAFATDGTGANDGNCTNKALNRNHDKHGTGQNEVDARIDIQNNDFSSH